MVSPHFEDIFHAIQQRETVYFRQMQVRQDDRIRIIALKTIRFHIFYRFFAGGEADDLGTSAVIPDNFFFNGQGKQVIIQ